MVAFFIGGSTQESNLPKRFLTPSNGFEDRASHQCPSCFQYTEGLDRNLALLVYGALGEIRTPDTQIRSLVLYPAELQAHNNNISGGERGIRTLDTGFPVYSLSRRAPSTYSAISP